MDEKNQIDESIYNEKSLYLLNIKELRALGRRFGVPSPASKKKKELVDYILNIVYGKIEVPTRNPYGRPSTNEFDMDKYLSKIKKNYDVSGELKTITFNKNYGYAMLSSCSSTYNVMNNIVTRVFCESQGKYYLRIRGFVESSEDIEVSEAFAKKFNLENFDIVEVIKSNSLFKVYSINGQKIKDEIRKIYVDGKELVWGQKQDFYLSTKEELNNSINKLIKDSEFNNVKLIILSENDYNHKDNTIVVSYEKNEDVGKIYKKFMMVMGLCEKYVIDGDDLIVCIEDSDIIENTINKFDEDVYERINNYIQDMFDTIINLGNIYLSFKIEKDFKY